MPAIEDLPRDDDEASVSDDDDDDDEVEFTRAELQTFLARMGGNLTDAAAEGICDVIASFTYYELNALVVGNTGRQLTEDQWNELLNDDSEDEEEEEDEEDELEDGEIPSLTVDNMRITTYMNDGSWARTIVRRDEDNAATKFQAVWRGFKGRMAFMEKRVINILATMA